uniref:Uncharacterized protein n=1 Tax=Siphoviridae sp. ctW4q29 TaxID=2825535 RepID=A0A8S5TRV4_9CAUD|nr:MAG TPA: hypothetical protein [Siphoviridae sp. ctW4q29]
MIRHSHPPVFPLNPFPPSYAPPVLGAPSGTERSYRHKQPVGKPIGCCYMPCARCTPRSGAGGRTSHTAPIYAGVAQSDRAEQGKCRVSVAGSSPAACTRGRVAPGHCETVVVMAHMKMTMLAENCA